MTLTEAWEKAKIGQLIVNDETHYQAEKTGYNETLVLTIRDVESKNWEIKKEKHTMYTNIWKKMTCYATYDYSPGVLFPTEEEAIKKGENKSNYVTTVKIEWED